MDPTAANFVHELSDHQSDEELRKIQRYFKSGDGEYGHGDVFLGVRMGDVFLETAPDLVRLIRKDERRAVEWNPNHFLLSPPDERRLQAIESHIPPGAGAGDEAYSFPGDVEFVYVMAGTLELRVGDETYRLEQGDVLTYPLREPHTWSNPSKDETAVVLWVAVPNPYASAS